MFLLLYRGAIVVCGSMFGLEANMRRSNVPSLRGSFPVHEPESRTLDGWFWIFTSMPTAFHLSTRTCCTRSRSWSPVVVTYVSDNRTPFLVRMPSEPLTHPEVSRAELAFAGSYPSCVPVYFAQPCETGEDPGFALPNRSLSMICCYGVAYRRALRTALSARMGCLRFGSGYSLFCGCLFSIRW